MAVCPRCGEENPDRFRMCGMCGAPLSTGQAPERRERRVVSVVFADLAGFTSRSERLDVEDVDAFLAPYRERLRQEVERHGGVVSDFAGDGMMAVFGAPVAHEDDPERAVRAALAIRDGAAELLPGASRWRDALVLIASGRYAEAAALYEQIGSGQLAAEMHLLAAGRAAGDGRTGDVRRHTEAALAYAERSGASDMLAQARASSSMDR